MFQLTAAPSGGVNIRAMLFSLEYVLQDIYNLLRRKITDVHMVSDTRTQYYTRAITHTHAHMIS